ncbi:hypothetical protein Psuf_046140 [Phytohabitans suffuscus]|uniref:Uncharacterized protein n=1 Tax=Phytohabitans suffuscus TaxID=624315 RepID=A0A6F8YMZ1_9ACTN|nr:hypothetical protein Psuf_046140 [Phytohabitans suffuscus]
MPHHRVERVDRAVADKAGQPGDRAPEERGDDRVGRVFRDRLDRGAGQLRLVERGRVAPAEVAEASARRRQVGPLQRPAIWPASRRNVRPPSTAQVPAATSTARATGRRRVAALAATATATGTPTATAVNAAPATRSGR